MTRVRIERSRQYGFTLPGDSVVVIDQSLQQTSRAFDI